MKKMLIDAAHAEETRVVILDGNRVDDFESETQGKQQHKGNIYVGTVSRVEPSLQAAFISYGANRNGFLAFAEVHPEYFALKAPEKANLLTELAEQAARRRGEDDAEDSALEQPAYSPRPPREGRPERAAERAEGRGAGRGNRPERFAGNTSRGRPQRVGADSPNAADTAADAEPELPFGPAISAAALPNTEAVTHAGAEAASTYYEDPEDAAAARKAAAMAEAADNATEGNANAPAKAGRGGRKTYKPGSKPQAGGKAGPRTEGGRRPKRMNARRPARQLEATAEGLSAESQTEAMAMATENAVAPTATTTQPVTEVMAVTVPEAIPTVTPEAAPEATSAERPRSSVSHGTVHRKYRIQDVLKEGQKVLVQVVKEERGSKGAALTTYFSLPGRYTVLMPNTPNAGGISRKITDYEERRQLRDTFSALSVPATMGLIIRTAGMGQEIDAIKADYTNLQQLWSHITQEFDKHDDIQCVHEDGSIIVRALRDMASDEVSEIIISGQRAYKQAKDFAKAFMPETLKKISLYKEEAPIFSHHKVEDKLLQLHHERVQLPSGGSIVINPTEALVAIDINSGRNTSERNIEETAYKTNTEACEEIARQIRLRDLAGLIVVDFIDMENFGNTRKIEQAMRRALKRDRARIQTGGISEFGLMEISRQRLRPSFAENHTVACPHCGGSGLLVSPSSAGLMLLRRLEEEDATGADRITVCAASSTVMWVLNHKRDLIRSLEEKYKFQLLFKADDSLLAPDARLELVRLKADGSEAASQINLELREQPEVPPEKRYTAAGRAQRQREDEQRDELKQADKATDKPTEKAADKPARTERPERQGARPERQPRSDSNRRPSREAAHTAPVAESATLAKPANKPERTAAPKVAKPKVVAEDQPLAMQKVAADTSTDTPIAAPKAKKFALKMQADTDSDVTPIAVAKVSADAGIEATTAKAPRAKKAEKAPEKTSILNRLLGL